MSDWLLLTPVHVRVCHISFHLNPKKMKTLPKADIFIAVCISVPFQELVLNCLSMCLDDKLP